MEKFEVSIWGLHVQAEGSIGIIGAVAVVAILLIMIRIARRPRLEPPKGAKSRLPEPM